MSSDKDTTNGNDKLQRKDSMSSVSSKVSKGSTASKLTLSSKISGLVKRSCFRGPRSTTHSVADMVDLAAGDQCETISIVTVRQEESIESPVVVELATNTTLDVLALGEGRRIKIRTCVADGKKQSSEEMITGWISSKTKLNEPLVIKLKPEIYQGSDFEVGGKHVVKSMVTVRESEAIDSQIVCDLQPGSTITILDLGAANMRRAKISSTMQDGSTATGWISTTTKTGEVLIGKPDEIALPPGQSTLLNRLGSSSKIKQLLECSRSGDLDTVKAIVEGSSTSIMKSFTTRINLNASDLRGKTALIYAAAFGNKEIVQYLLTKEEVDVNALDDTHKSALHHASKRAASRRHDNYDGCQEAIVRMLVERGAHIEAREHYGCTPLMFSVAAGCVEITKYLLSCGARHDIRDFEGHKALDYARNFQHKGMEKLLYDHGARDDEDEVLQSSSKEAAAEPAGDAAAPAAAPKKKMVKKKVASKAGAKKAAKDSANKRRLSNKNAMVPVFSTAMMNAAADEAHAEVNVEDAAKEEEDEKTRMLRKLKLVLETVQVPKELEVAVVNAEAAGASEAELEQAKTKLKALQALTVARSALQQAVNDKDVVAIKEALSKAGDAGVPKKEIDNAKAVLKVEEPKMEALQKLDKAQKSGNAADLRKAIEEAEKVSVSAADLQEFKDLLAGAESKDKAAKALGEAIQSRDVVQLRFAIQQAKDVGLDVAEAEAILKEEEPKQKAREQLEEALHSKDMGALKTALENAKKVNLTQAEYAEVEEMIHNLEEQKRLLELVEKCKAEALACDRTSIDAVREAKTKLHNAFTEATMVGIPETQLQEADRIRKKMHNLIEDLKGSIRVFCRVRPLSKKETGQGDKDVVQQLNSMTLAVGQNQFSFDSVFVGKSKQEDIFEDCKDLVQSALDGYNVTLFAYGQTGSGKTYTMEGVREEDSRGKILGWKEEGVSPRVINEIFKCIGENEHRYTFTVLASMVELYRQDLVDLLTKGDPSKSKSKLNVRLDSTGNVMVEHLTAEEVRSADELRNVFKRGVVNRKVTATQMNSDSSRSHLVCIVQIISVNHETKEQTRGKMLLVDLAGSERLKKSQTTGDEQKESIEINKSLTALGDVIEALTKKSKGQVIPYRNHKLTQLMQDSLGGSAKTLMFVNCSPASSNEDETLMSLKYAQRAKMITNTIEKKK